MLGRVPWGCAHRAIVALAQTAPVTVAVLLADGKIFIAEMNEIHHLRDQSSVGAVADCGSFVGVAVESVVNGKLKKLTLFAGQIVDSIEKLNVHRRK